MAKISLKNYLKFLTCLLENKPQSFKETIPSPEALFQKEAINNEIEFIIQNHT